MLEIIILSTGIRNVLGNNVFKRVQHWQLSGRSDNVILFRFVSFFFLNSEVSLAKDTALFVPDSAVDATADIF